MKKHRKGFTLAELLIALAILGVIATFTIPKVLQSQQDGKYKAAAKEAAAMVSGAYASYSLQNTPTGATRFSDLTQYMNYVSRITTGLIDGHELEANIDCSVTSCLKLHNGGIIRYPNTISFSGTGSTNAISFSFDPDGTQNNNHSVQFWMYINGRITTNAGILPNSTSSSYTAPTPCPACDPPWFSWN